MCEREKSLGEEIINLVRLGVETNVVERMYRKYIDLCTGKKKNVDCDIATGQSVGRWDAIAVGDKIEIPLGNLGTFTATVHKVADNKALLIFDDYITVRPMNEEADTNMGGYDNSDLKRWINTELYDMFPEGLKSRMTKLSIPTIGEIFGLNDEWCRNNVELDGNKQLPLMKQKRNRIAFYKNEFRWGWLRNAIKAEISSSAFALVSGLGCANHSNASGSGGVRPEFWLEM